jgi:energy-dependent translational throttle protein EttA
MSDEPNKVIYSMVGVGKVHGTRKVLKDMYLGYFYGAKIGVLGLNGSGKSTLLRIMAGVDTEIIGHTVVSPGFTIGYLEQEPQLDTEKTVREIVEEGVQDTVDLLKEFEDLSMSLGEPMDDDQMEKVLNRQGEVQDRLDALDAWDLDSRLQMAMDALLCPPGETSIGVLSGGELRRVALCRLLLQKPDILLLDEPTNHLDATTVGWLEQHLQRYEGTVIAVTHDRYFLDNVAGWILELDRGHGIPWEGNYSSWLEQKAKRLAQEERTESERRKTLERELEWIKMSPKGRRAKGKARINAFDALASQEVEKLQGELEIYIPPGPRLGDIVIQGEGLAKSFDRPIFAGLNFIIQPGAIVGLVGPNGAGKSTLFKMFVGEEKPDEGTLRIGETVKLAYADQSRSTLKPEMTVWEAITGGAEHIELGRLKMNSRAYVGRFNFSGGDQQKSVEHLSGGERNRVHLARILMSDANVILLDEPTNDLDVNTMRALEDALVNFAGCAIIISHDRWFLNRVATHILAFEADGPVWCEGDYSAYEEDRRRRLGADADKQQRYRQLTR